MSNLLLALSGCKKGIVKWGVVVAGLITVTHIQAQNYQGSVFGDNNGNGKMDAGEPGIAGVLVSNGLLVTKTDKLGRFLLPGPVTNHFLFITVPNGFQTDTFYKAAGNSSILYNFPLRKQPGSPKDEVSFVHITDTETPEYGSWIDDLKGYAKHSRPDFMIHTGDICYVEGLKFHSKNINSQTMGLPVFYCVGNHDLVKGAYGEELYESLFGPAYYSFEAGNVHFIVTPMLGGDVKPGYTKKQVYEWMKNDLKMKPKNQPVVIFNHDLQSNIDNNKFLSENKFIYGISDSAQIDLVKNNLVAWVYGHWHTELVKKPGKVLTVCSNPPDKGGIDHSISSFRVINIDKKGKVSIETKYSYQEQQLEIVSPKPDMQALNADGRVPVVVNTYHTTSPVTLVEFAVTRQNEKPLWQKMTQGSSWSWHASWKPSTAGATAYSISVRSTTASGESFEKTLSFNYSPGNSLSIKTADEWPMLLQNVQHHPSAATASVSSLKLAWVANAGAPIYNASPLIIGNYTVTATTDEGNLNQGKIIAFNSQHGSRIWSYRTENAIKGAIAYSHNTVLAVDVLGCLYAVDIATGKLVWKKQLDENFMPANLQGVIARNDTVFAGGGKGLYALRVSNGQEIWRNNDWSQHEGSTANQSLAGNVLLGSSNWAALYANDATSGKLLWSRNDEGLRFRDAALPYIDGKLYALGGTKFFEMNPSDGKILRSKNLDSFGVKSFSTPILSADAFVFGTAKGGVIALDKKTLDIKWQFLTGKSLLYTSPYSKPDAASVESSPLPIGNSIFFGASDGNIYLLDANTGKLQWKTALGAPVFASPAISGNLLVVADFAGNIYGFQVK